MTEQSLDKDSLEKITVVMVLLNAFTTPLMLSSANVALPVIARELKVDAVLLSWVPMAYLMASAMFVLIFGRLADMFGRKRIFLLGTIGVIITSIFASLCQSGEMLVFARFMQGICAAMLYATQVALVTSVTAPEKRGKVIGLTVSMIYIGLTAGPFIGGYLIEFFSWQAAFVFHIPLALLVLLIGISKVKSEWKAEQAGKFDLTGAILYPLSIALFCFGVSGLPNESALVYLALSLVLLWSFFHFQHKTEHPIFNVNLFYTNRVFTYSCLASLIMYTAVFANVVLVSLYLQFLKGVDAGVAGTIMMTQPLSMALFAPVAGRLSDKVEPKVIASFGIAITLIGLFLLSKLHSESSILYICVALAMSGIGFGFFSSPNANAIMSTVEKRFYGSVTGVLATMRNVGQLSSMALVTLVFALTIGSVTIEPENYSKLGTAINQVFLIAALLCLPGLFFSLSRGYMHKE